MLTSLLIVLLSCMVLMIPYSDSCQLPTRTNPVSICGFCSDIHAGVRLMIHSNPANLDSIDIVFHCDSLENETYNYDDCFDGLNFPGVNSIDKNVWSWHILERKLPVGTNCTFKAKYKKIWDLKPTELHTSCIIREKTCSVIPSSMCSGEPGDSQCSCNCGQGFTPSDTLSAVGLHCTNIDECSSDELHNCNSASDCVDTEGSYWCNQTYDGSDNQSIPVKDLSSLSEGPCTGIDGTTARETMQLTTTLSIKAVKTSFDSPSTNITNANNSTFLIAGKGEINSITVIPLMTILSLTLIALVVLTTIALKRYLSKSERTKKSQQCYIEQFDPEFNPVAIGKFTATKISSESILNSLHDLVTHSINEPILGAIDLETESCMSDVTCTLEPTGQVSDGEQSSTYSQVWDGSTAEPHSTMTIDMTATNKHKRIAIDHQQMGVSTSYQPQASSNTAYLQLDSDTNHGGPPMYQKSGTYLPHCSNPSVATPVYFEFPKCENQNILY